ncbi:hypothetical protein [Algivirga pacifica]|uniref:Outer membrane protein beta-barrel domain-containing protein n=1 Tax=Algivirga pacifica TaxID=1162670 RepID=A0ABP9DSN6_9BACT
MNNNPLKFVLLVLFTLITFQGYSQRIEVTGFGGFQFGGSIDFIEGDLKIKDNGNYGGMIDFAITPRVMLELGYTRMDTRAEWRPYPFYQAPPFNYERRDFGASVEYFQIGSLKNFGDPDGAFIPFSLLTAGLVRFNDKEFRGEDTWRFSVLLGGGMKYFINDIVGIRLQGRLMLPMFFDGVGGYVGIGTGGPSTGLGVNTTIPIVQGDITGGLVFRIRK